MPEIAKLLDYQKNDIHLDKVTSLYRLKFLRLCHLSKSFIEKLKVKER